MNSDTPMVESPIPTNSEIQDKIKTQPKRKCAQTICFILIVTMNLSAWIDLMGIFAEIPLMISFVPEGWALPSILNFWFCAANVMPIVVILIRWWQGKRFSEIPYIYIIIIIGIVACTTAALFWRKTAYVFGRERSVWLIGSVFVLSMLDATSSLVFFDYMKRFRIRYLGAVFLGEGLSGAIPSFLLLIQGMGDESNCPLNNNGTNMESTLNQPRISITTYIFLISSVIVASLIAFLLLRWTNIIKLADAGEPKLYKEPNETSPEKPLNTDEDLSRSPPTDALQSPKPLKTMKNNTLIFLLCLNTYYSCVLYGILPSISTYILLPYHPKLLYYSALLNSLIYFTSSIISIKCGLVSIRIIVMGSILATIFSVCMITVAARSPCPWFADTLHGAVMVFTIWLLLSFISAYLRISSGNYIKANWSKDKGMFYFGTSIQIGTCLGTIPMYFLVNVFDVFVAREPCKTYCVA